MPAMSIQPAAGNGIGFVGGGGGGGDTPGEKAVAMGLK